MEMVTKTFDLSSKTRIVAQVQFMPSPSQHSNLAHTTGPVRLRLDLTLWSLIILAKDNKKFLRLKETSTITSNTPVQNSIHGDIILMNF